MHKLGLVTVAVAGVVALLTACGGSSKSGAFTEPEGGNGSGATGSGKAGSTSSDAGEGPDSGGTSSSTGGSTGTGGKALGGTGGGGIVPMVDPMVREGCDDWCAGVTDAACNDDTLAD